MDSLPSIFPKLLVAFSIIYSCTSGPGKSTLYNSVIPSDSIIVLSDVNLLTMEDEEVLEHRTIIIKDGLIEDIGMNGTIKIPPGAIILDAKGFYLIPGLFDMHVHLNEDDLPVFLKSGITGVRNMWGTPNVKEIIRKIEEDEIRGPAVYSSSPGIDGNPPTWPYTKIIEDPREAPTLVNQLKNEGWEFLKVYNKLKPEVYIAVIKAARELDMRVLGHVPIAVDINTVLRQKQYSVEHLTGYDQSLGGTRGFRAWTDINESIISELATETAHAGTWNCPTLVVLDHLSRQMNESLRNRAENNRFTLVKALFDEGAGLLIGTDAGIGFTKPGISLHQELQKFASAGISPVNVLQKATREAAKFLEVDNKMGTITRGKRANMVLLKANPLEDITNTTRIEGIILNGAWIPVNLLD